VVWGCSPQEFSELLEKSQDISDNSLLVDESGRLDRDYMFEDHCIRGLKKMKLMVGLSMIIMNGMAIGKIKNGKKKIRSLKNAA